MRRCKGQSWNESATHRIDARKLLWEMHHEGNYELLPVHRRADLEEHTEQKKSLVTAVDFESTDFNAEIRFGL